jgi:hypothetical protein
MERQTFLRELQKSARELQSKFSARGTKWVSSICTGRTHDGQRLTRDSIYELMCCFALVAALKSKVSNLRVLSSADTGGFRFPMKPGRKKAFAFFRFEHSAKSYDICCGIEIPTKAGEPPEAPDISLQEHGLQLLDVDRRDGTPIAIWDAKYHEDAVSKSDVQQMNWWCDIFDIPRCQTGDLLSQISPPVFQVSAVITNSTSKKFNKSQMLKRKFSILFSFAGEHNHCILEPTRAEHEATT